MTTEATQKKTHGDLAAAAPRTEGAGSGDPLAVQQLSDPLTDPLQGSGDLWNGGGAVQFEDPEENAEPRLVLGEAERLPDPNAAAQGGQAGAEEGHTGPRLVLGEAERIPTGGEEQGGGGERLILGEAERIDK